MPELPEVHTIVQGINKSLLGYKILEVRDIKKKYNLLSQEDIDSKVINATIVSAERLAKQIVLNLDNQHSLSFHLAMTGKLLLREPGHPQDKAERLVLNLIYQNGARELRFCDTRLFGKVKILHSQEIEKSKNNFGLDPTTKEFNSKNFYNVIKSKNTSIKNLLMDQRKIAGLGNIYATDALWLANINPTTHTSQITKEQASKLLDSVISVLNEGIAHRGISMRDYVDLYGEKGSHQNHFKVYQQSHCSRCQCEIQTVRINGRATYFCPLCQPHKDKTLNKKISVN
ncbi:bifunctional DNA-formamidopyrimidine glycosylase/DNA-(apurinic or apyrimidinic site) lyase [Candidatus Nomurabacteria bacterium]|uniref:Bifunctional DNA-formamidopyrimidine glycosylase/DNA-(Apurinic or apyrimidinic site) lyase n=1 Tax=candidate division WWE3 bacterium TaxID=2053526 RepID=A0A955DZ82_UNCKA|nr:bifunctional DNA-formamidopyrimidine glycosylase/DNA-(apurinic or apyrimidinic site) lyase [candidate division WWE3 bacterium]MCB9823575.1 bifunctional DNA-formamidopyrimidine glycosylase/DNA-(apurinic or apyrimidinic site) lyase [Candidatus Nomurabacteria bacterium]MCB9827370.1 bifunctional DNA-formamidopyrimidine glycosylase/DNA-(apurinic or apyrimidinic site) lyase [Candidatus Nomurabacteria bacterium]HXK52676.1 bifunctional DNA-formamidopyrimidine glycosylase/DNA-(apurinic or apyrimidinic